MNSKFLPMLEKKMLIKNQKLAIAESCTGGMMSMICTDRPGSSNWFECGFVTYSNKSKQDMLGVDPQIILDNGAVSEATVVAMATGALQKSSADYAIAISGVAGPDGGGDNPVGTVWFGFANQRTSFGKKQFFTGDRTLIREQSVEFALRTLVQFISV